MTSHRCESLSQGHRYPFRPCEQVLLGSSRLARFCIWYHKRLNAGVFGFEIHRFRMDRLNHDDQSNFLPGRGELFRGFQSQQPAQAEAANEIGPFRLKAPQFGDISCRHFFQSRVLNQISIEAACLKRIDRLIRFQLMVPPAGG